MANLPEEVWTAALQAGVRAGVLDYRDLCSLSIASRWLNRLSSLACLWKPLIERDFPSKQATPTNQVACKENYKARFEKIKAVKVAAHKRQLLRLQSDSAALEKECKGLELQIQEERSKLSNIFRELKCLEQARISSVALRLWQPDSVRTMQQQVVEQQPIDPQYRQFSLEMEARVCRQQIGTCNKRLDKIRQAIQNINMDLEFLTYNPLQILEDHVQQTRSRKKLRTGKDLVERQST